MNVKSLIIGNGEIGSSLKKVLDLRKNKGKTITYDVKDLEIPDIYEVEIMHICIPYTEQFVSEIVRYAKKYIPSLIIIHSTVPVGTTSIINKILKKENLSEAVHSPVRGTHPRLTESLLYFTKYIGTSNKKAYLIAKKEMSNMKTKWFKKSEETELGKLLCTAYYGLCISWHRETEKMCKYFKVDFDNVMTDFNITYNKGYKKFKQNVIRPVLTSPGKEKIGGHCIIPNAKILNSQIKSDFLKLIK